MNTLVYLTYILSWKMKRTFRSNSSCSAATSLKLKYAELAKISLQCSRACVDSCLWTPAAENLEMWWFPSNFWSFLFYDLCFCLWWYLWRRDLCSLRSSFTLSEISLCWICIALSCWRRNQSKAAGTVLTGCLLATTVKIIDD